MNKFILHLGVLLLVVTVSVQAQQKPTTKVAAAKKPGFFTLTAYKDALSDLQGAVVAGVNRQDYQHKLQIAAAESIKAEDRLSEWEAKPPVTPLTNAVRACYRNYGSALFYYQWAATKWDHLLFVHKDERDPDEASKADKSLQELWSKAETTLGQARTSYAKAKLNEGDSGGEEVNH
jgi:hypothetical protein